MADAKAPTTETVTVAPNCNVSITVAASHATFLFHKTYDGDCKTVTAKAGQTIEVPTAAAAELREDGYVV